MEEEYVNTDPCLDENGEWPQKADEVMPDITDVECQNFGAFTGLDGNQKSNCDDLTALVCAIKQECDAINISRAIVIAANDASKCQDDDLPTLASMWSRILRYVQATTCMLCEYDPRLATILKTGRYPQILMGSQQAGGYPQWVMPEDYAYENSEKPVSSAGVYKTINDALLSAWHYWEEQPEFDYFAQTLDDPDDIRNLEGQMADWPASLGDTALVATQDGKTSLLYEFQNGKWVFVRQLTEEDDHLINFAVTHINKGYYQTKGVYYFDETWQVMDADLGELEQRVDELEKKFQDSILSRDEETEYMIMTRPSKASAEAVACTSGKESIILITG